MPSPDVVPPLSSELQDRGPSLRVYVIVLMALSFAAVVLRFWSRLLYTPDARGAKQRKLWWDDWTVLAAQICILVTGALMLDMIHLGLGKHIWVVPPQNLVPALTRLYMIYFWYDAIMVLAKTSCLFFYTRVFGQPTLMGWFKWAIYATHTLNILWLLGNIFGTVFMCDPVAKNYNPMLPGHCGTASSLWMGGGIVSAIIDLILLILPIPKIWGLRMKVRRKIAVLCICVFGYLVVVVSIGRLITIIKSEAAMNEDLTYEGVPGFYWTTAEGPIAVISVCLPGMLNLGRNIATSTISPLACTVTSNVSWLRSTGFKSGTGRSAARKTYGDLTSLENARKTVGETELIWLEPDKPSESYHWKASVANNAYQSTKEPRGNQTIAQKNVAITSKPPGSGRDG